MCLKALSACIKDPLIECLKRTRLNKVISVDVDRSTLYPACLEKTWSYQKRRRAGHRQRAIFDGSAMVLGGIQKKFEGNYEHAP